MYYTSSPVVSWLQSSVPSLWPVMEVRLSDFPQICIQIATWPRKVTNLLEWYVTVTCEGGVPLGFPGARCIASG